MRKLSPVQRQVVAERMALRTVDELTDSGRIVLNGPRGEDIGEEYWVVFAEANAMQIDKLRMASVKEIVRRTIGGRQDEDAEEAEEVVERHLNLFGLIQGLHDLRLLKEATFPRMEGGQLIAHLLSPTELRSGDWLKEVPPALQPSLLEALNDFYFPEDEAAMGTELGNLPTRPESSTEGEKQPTSST